MVSIQQIERGVARFVDAEIMPNIGGGTLARLVVGTAAGVVTQRVGKLLETYTNNPVLRAIGVVNDAQEVDIDLLVPEMRKSIPSEGLKVNFANPLTGVPLVSMTFHAADVDRLHQYIIGG